MTTETKPGHISARQAIASTLLAALMIGGWFAIQANAETESNARRAEAEARTEAIRERARERYALDFRPNVYVDGAIAAGDGKRTFVLVSRGCERGLVEDALRDRRAMMTLQDLQFTSIGCAAPQSTTGEFVLPIPSN